MGQKVSAAEDEPDIVKTVTKTLTRDEVMDEMQPILQRLRDVWTEELSADIAAALTPQKLKLMSPRAKASFAEWINEQEDEKYLQWLKNASDDVLSMTWKETQRIPDAKIWSQQHPIAISLWALEMIADAFDPEEKEFIQTQVREIKEYLQCEKEREHHQVEQFTATVLKAIERAEAAILGRLEVYHDEVRSTAKMTEKVTGGTIFMGSYGEQ
ncbi:hypothetical protein V8C26DRAFT_392113 [Trichoderma gracile]